MFTIGFKVLPTDNITELEFVDESTGDENLVSRTITLVKSDLSSNDYLFPNDVDESLFVTGILDKDYALRAIFTVVTDQDTYTKELFFITVGYSTKRRRERVKRDSLDFTIEDKELYRKTTLDINYYLLVANDRVAFSDLIGSQLALDYVADIAAREALSPFSI